MNRFNSEPTIVDVARKASVSVGTVSHVVSGSRFVRPETRERVEQAIRELGYRPNRVAQALSSQRTNTIGMIIPDVANPFFAELLRGVVDGLAAAEYAVLFADSDNDLAKERLYARAFRDRRVDGIISVIAADADAEAMLSLGMDLPMVIVDRLIPGWTGDCVTCANETGMRQAVEYLLSLGHREIVLLNGDPRLSTGGERRRGFEAALYERGLKPAAIIDGDFTFESGHRLVSQTLNAPRRPTAICASNDLLALGALAAAHDSGIRVPQDLSIVGYDDIVFARLVTPAITTVRQPARAMGAEAAQLMLDRLKGEGGPGRRVVLQPELVIRESTAPPGMSR